MVKTNVLQYTRLLHSAHDCFWSKNLIVAFPLRRVESRPFESCLLEGTEGFRGYLEHFCKVANENVWELVLLEITLKLAVTGLRIDNRQHALTSVTGHSITMDGYCLWACVYFCTGTLMVT